MDDLSEVEHWVSPGVAAVGWCPSRTINIACFTVGVNRKIETIPQGITVSARTLSPGMRGSELTLSLEIRVSPGIRQGVRGGGSGHHPPPPSV